MSTHRQIGPIHIFRGTAKLVVTDRLDGVDPVCGTEIRLPIQFASCPSVSTTVYCSEIPFAQPISALDCKAQYSLRTLPVFWNVDIQMPGSETQIIIYALNPDRSLTADTYFCDYLVVGDV